MTKPKVKLTTLENVFKGSASNYALNTYWPVEEIVETIHKVQESINQFNKWKYSDE